MPHLRRPGLVVLVAVALLVGLAGCDRGSDTAAAPGSEQPPSTAGGTATVPAVERPRGGSARVGVWARPDVDAPTLGGAAVRALVLPQLFIPNPDGTWAPSLVEPGSDRTAPDSRSASFRLRPAAAWSDGSPIGVDDLRRSADPRFVAAIDGPAPDGTLTVIFTQPLPAWPRLWSLTDSVAPPGPGVWGGPFTLVSATPGLETVLRRNDGWAGGPGPFLDELRLVLVPDATTARQLLARGELDVVMPPAHTARTRQLDALDGVSLAGVNRGGWWVGLLLNPARLDGGERRGVVASVDRRAFASALLRGEAVPLDGLASPEDATWAEVDTGDTGGLKGETVDVVGTVEEPMTNLLQRSMQKRVRAGDGTLELRNAEADRVEGWLREGSYDAAVAVLFDAPEPCWRCRWESVDGAAAELASRADAGDRTAMVELEAKLRDEALALPLWRPRTVVAWRDGLGGVRANGYGLSAAWNAWEWWREAG